MRTFIASFLVVVWSQVNELIPTEELIGGELVTEIIFVMIMGFGVSAGLIFCIIQDIKEIK